MRYKGKRLPSITYTWLGFVEQVDGEELWLRIWKPDDEKYLDTTIVVSRQTCPWLKPNEYIVFSVKVRGKRGIITLKPMHMKPLTQWELDRIKERAKELAAELRLLVSE